MTINEYFDAPLDRVNSLLQLMVLCPKDDAPNWLRGMSKIEHLPRYSKRPDTLSYSGSIDFLRDREIAGRVRWIVETLHGTWALEKQFDQTSRILFGARLDAMRYAIRFATGRPPL